MTKAQKHLLMLFKEIIDICDRHDIVYYMAGGTLIGAIRHEGFIPWDDDMDILMTRDNWHKFLEVTKYDIPENRAVECQENNRDYPNMFGRYTDLTTSAIHKNEVLGDGKAGYVVDILVLDPIPDDEEGYKKYLEELMLYSDLINPSINYSYRWNINGDRFEEYYKRTLIEGKDAVLSEIENEIFTYPEDKCNRYAMRWGGAPFIFEKDMYGSSRYGIFEGLKCRIPDRTGDYLTWHYGDNWMYIPPHNEHESHDAIFSFTTDYKTIQKDYMRYIDIPAVRKSFINRKLFLLEEMEPRLEAKDLRAEIICEAIAMEIEAESKDKKEELKSWLINNEYEKITEFFSKYYDKQWDRLIIGREDFSGIYRFHNPHFIKIEDDLLYIALINLVHTNNIAKADRILNIRSMQKEPLTNELMEVREAITNIRSAISDYDLGRKEVSYVKVQNLKEKYPCNMSLIMLEIILNMDKDNYDRVYELCEYGLDKHNGVVDFELYKAICTYKKDKLEGLKLLSKYIDITNNGYIILKVKKMLKEDAKELEKIVASNCDAKEMLEVCFNKEC